MSTLAIRFERALVSYLGTYTPSLSIYPGHNNGDQTVLPRAIVTVASGGGDLVRGAGVDQLEIEIQILIGTGEAGTVQAGFDNDPLVTLAGLADTFRGALRESRTQEMITSFSSDPYIAFTGIEYEGYKEGRDPERSLHGIVMNFRAWAALVSGN
jgi:hypothetical protein